MVSDAFPVEADANTWQTFFENLRDFWSHVPTIVDSFSLFDLLTAVLLKENVLNPDFHGILKPLKN